MRLLQEIEKKLERLVEGIFSSRFPSALEPVELARLLDRKMREHRRVGLGSTYTPNSYVVRLSPLDHEGFAALGPSLQSELEGFIEDLAREEGYRLPGRARVTFEADPTLRLGESRITAASKPDTSPPAPPSIEGTFVAPPPRSEARPRVTGAPEAFSPPEATAGLRLPEELGGRVVRFSGSALIGRSQRCDVVLPLPEVSREHASIEVREGRFWLIDLGSTNGTYLNRKRVSASPLSNGDRIGLGPAQMTFEAKERPRRRR